MEETIYPVIRANGANFVQYGKMLVEKGIFLQVAELAPRGDLVGSWMNEQFKRADYRAIRNAGLYTESVMIDLKVYALLVLPGDGAATYRGAAFQALADVVEKYLEAA